jgi:ligand-binding sensor domain-containing protein
VYTRRDGLATNDIFRIFEDSRGGVLAGSIGLAGVNGLTRWDRGTDTFHSYPAHETSAASAFAEDRTGAVWIGYYDGALARYRDGSPTLFSPDDGLAGGGIQALHVDHAGRLWIASTRGLTRADAPNEPHPRFQHFGIEHGLSSSRTLCLDEDRWGRLYVATGSGIDRLNAAGEIVPARVHHYTEADGLAHGELRDILFDADGVLWCATSQGISRLNPEPESAAVPPPVLIRQLRVRGVPFPLSDLGETSVHRLTFAPGQNQLQIDYAALNFAPGQALQYQYRLDPTDLDWNPSSGQRTVNYSSVRPGEYRFSVRLASESAAAPRPASWSSGYWRRSGRRGGFA